MDSLVSYYLHECAVEKIERLSVQIIEAKISGDVIDGKDLDNDGIPDEFFVDLSTLIEDEFEFEMGESIKARAPKLKGKAEKARKAKSTIMRSLMSNPEIQGLVARLKAKLKMVARKEASTTGVSGRAINKALKHFFLFLLFLRANFLNRGLARGSALL